MNILAIVTGVNGTFNVNLFVFGQHSEDDICGHMGHVTHADPDQEPGCYPSWHWMPYQKQQAKKHATEVARAGWNGKGMFVYLVPANSYPAQTGAAKAFFGEGGMVPYNAYLALKGADDTVSTWAPSGSDALAEDWLIVE